MANSIIIPKVSGKFSSTSVNPGKPVTFTWSSANTVRLTLTGANIVFTSNALSGSKALTVPAGAKPGSKIIVTWIAYSSTGNMLMGSAMATVVALPIPTGTIIYPSISFSTNPTSSLPGQPTTITWQSTGTSKLTLSAPGWSQMGNNPSENITTSALSGSIVAIAPQVPAIYEIKITATSTTGFVKTFTFPRRVTAPLLPKPTPVVPVVTGGFIPSSAATGGTARLTWGSTGVTNMIMSSTDITFRASTISGNAIINIPSTFKGSKITINYIATSSGGDTRTGSFVLPIVAATVAPTVGLPVVTFTFTTSDNTVYVDGTGNPPIAPGKPFTISWFTTNVSSVTLSGLGLTTTRLSGTQTVLAPTVPGRYYIAVRAVGPGGSTRYSERVEVGLVKPVIVPTVVPVIQMSFSPTTVNMGASTTLTWQVTGATTVMLTSPPQLAINSTALSGSRTVTVPNAPGVYIATISVPSATGVPKSAQAYLQVINPQELRVIPPEGLRLPDCAVGSPYQYQYTASGGVPPYRFAIDDRHGVLPYGLTMNSAGAITGTPIATQKTRTSFVVMVTDSVNSTDRIDGVIKIAIVAVAELKISGWPGNMQLPDGTVGSAYSYQLSAEGGVAPYVFSTNISYPLPAGLTLSTTGLITGTPTIATDLGQDRGLNPVIYVTDAAGTRDGRDFFIRVRT